MSAPILDLWNFVIFRVRTTFYIQFWRDDLLIDSLLFSLWSPIFIGISYWFLFGKDNNSGLDCPIVRSIKIDSKELRKLLKVSLSILFIGLMISGRYGENIFVSGGYGKGRVETLLGLSIFSEATILPLLGLISISNSYKERKLPVFLVLIFSVYNFLFGARIEAVQLWLLVLLCFWWKKLSLRNIMFIIVIVYLVSLYINAVRALGRLVLPSEVTKALFMIPKSEYISSTQGDIYYNLLIAIGLIKDKIIELRYGVYYLTLLPVSFMPYKFAISLFGEVALPPSYIFRVYTGHGIGSYFISAMILNFWILAVIFMFFYIFIYCYLSKILLYKFSRHQNLGIFAIVWVATLPRSLWYGDVTFIKLGIWSIIFIRFLIYCIEALNIIFSYKKKNSKGRF
jgi:hypothetical protein